MASSGPAAACVALPDGRRCAVRVSEGGLQLSLHTGDACSAEEADAGCLKYPEPWHCAQVVAVAALVEQSGAVAVICCDAAGGVARWVGSAALRGGDISPSFSPPCVTRMPIGQATVQCVAALESNDGAVTVALGCSDATIHTLQFSPSQPGSEHTSVIPFAAALQSGGGDGGSERGTARAEPTRTGAAANIVGMLWSAVGRLTGGATASSPDVEDMHEGREQGGMPTPSDDGTVSPPTTCAVVSLCMVELPQENAPLALCALFSNGVVRCYATAAPQAPSSSRKQPLTALQLVWEDRLATLDRTATTPSGDGDDAADLFVVAGKIAQAPFRPAPPRRRNTAAATAAAPAAMAYLFLSAVVAATAGGATRCVALRVDLRLTSPPHSAARAIIAVSLQRTAPLLRVTDEGGAREMMPWTLVAAMRSPRCLLLDVVPGPEEDSVLALWGSLPDPQSQASALDAPFLAVYQLHAPPASHSPLDEDGAGAVTRFISLPPVGAALAPALALGGGGSPMGRGTAGEALLLPPTGPCVVPLELLHPEARHVFRWAAGVGSAGGASASGSPTGAAGGPGASEHSLLLVGHKRPRAADTRVDLEEWGADCDPASVSAAYWRLHATRILAEWAAQQQGAAGAAAPLSQGTGPLRLWLHTLLRFPQKCAGAVAATQPPAAPRHLHLPHGGGAVDSQVELLFEALSLAGAAPAAEWLGVLEGDLEGQDGAATAEALRYASSSRPTAPPPPHLLPLIQSTILRAVDWLRGLCRDAAISRGGPAHPTGLTGLLPEGEEWALELRTHALAWHLLWACHHDAAAALLQPLTLVPVHRGQAGAGAVGRVLTPGCTLAVPLEPAVPGAPPLELFPASRSHGSGTAAAREVIRVALGAAADSGAPQPRDAMADLLAATLGWPLGGSGTAPRVQSSGAPLHWGSGALWTDPRVVSAVAAMLGVKPFPGEVEAAAAARWAATALSLLLPGPVLQLCALASGSPGEVEVGVLDSIRGAVASGFGTGAPSPGGQKGASPPPHTPAAPSLVHRVLGAVGAAFLPLASASIDDATAGGADAPGPGHPDPWVRLEAMAASHGLPRDALPALRRAVAASGAPGARGLGQRSGAAASTAEEVAALVDCVAALAGSPGATFGLLSHYVRQQEQGLRGSAPAADPSLPLSSHTPIPASSAPPMLRDLGPMAGPFACLLLAAVEAVCAALGRVPAAPLSRILLAGATATAGEEGGSEPATASGRAVRSLGFAALLARGTLGVRGGSAPRAPPSPDPAPVLLLRALGADLRLFGARAWLRCATVMTRGAGTSGQEEWLLLPFLESSPAVGGGGGLQGAVGSLERQLESWWWGQLQTAPVAPAPPASGSAYWAARESAASSLLAASLAAPSQHSPPPVAPTALVERALGLLLDPTVLDPVLQRLLRTKQHSAAGTWAQLVLSGLLPASSGPGTNPTAEVIPGPLAAAPCAPHVIHAYWHVIGVTHLAAAASTLSSAAASAPPSPHACLLSSLASHPPSCAGWPLPSVIQAVAREGGGTLGAAAVTTAAHAATAVAAFSLAIARVPAAFLGVRAAYYLTVGDYIRSSSELLGAAALPYYASAVQLLREAAAAPPAPGSVAAAAAELCVVATKRIFELAAGVSPSGPQDQHPLSHPHQQPAGALPLHCSAPALPNYPMAHAAALHLPHPTQQREALRRLAEAMVERRDFGALSLLPPGDGLEQLRRAASSHDIAPLSAAAVRMLGLEGTWGDLSSAHCTAAPPSRYASSAAAGAEQRPCAVEFLVILHALQSKQGSHREAAHAALTLASRLYSSAVGEAQRLGATPGSPNTLLLTPGAVAALLQAPDVAPAPGSPQQPAHKCTLPLLSLLQGSLAALLDARSSLLRASPAEARSLVLVVAPHGGSASVRPSAAAAAVVVTPADLNAAVLVLQAQLHLLAPGFCTPALHSPHGADPCASLPLHAATSTLAGLRSGFDAFAPLSPLEDAIAPGASFSGLFKELLGRGEYRRAWQLTDAVRSARWPLLGEPGSPQFPTLQGDGCGTVGLAVEVIQALAWDAASASSRSALLASAPQAGVLHGGSRGITEDVHLWALLHELLLRAGGALGAAAAAPSFPPLVVSRLLCVCVDSILTAAPRVCLPPWLQALALSPAHGLASELMLALLRAGRALDAAEIALTLLHPAPCSADAASSKNASRSKEWDPERRFLDHCRGVVLPYAALDAVFRALDDAAATAGVGAVEADNAHRAFDAVPLIAGAVRAPEAAAAVREELWARLVFRLEEVLPSADSQHALEAQAAAAASRR